jgi:hypothetical protein
MAFGTRTVLVGMSVTRSGSFLDFSKRTRLLRSSFENSQAAATVARLPVSRPEDNLDINFKGIEDGNKPVHGIACVSAIHEFGNIGLTNAQPGAGLDLGEFKLLDAVGDLARQQGLDMKFLSVWEVKVRKDIVGSSGDRDVGGGLSGHMPAKLGLTSA